MHRFFQQPCQFVAGAATLDALPPVEYPEIAFVGRSNVGKSSLVNALVGQKALARTSQSPGRTQQINFFLLGEMLMLVDLPGYGYAKVSKQQKKEWDHLIGSYLCGRPNLKRTCVLVDARRGVMEADETCFSMLDDAAASFQIILTKIDTVKPSELKAVMEATRKIVAKHPAAHPEIIATSSEGKLGLDVLQEALVAFAHPL